MAVATTGTASNYLQRAPSPSGLADVVELTELRGGSSNEIKEGIEEGAKHEAKKAATAPASKVKEKIGRH